MFWETVAALLLILTTFPFWVFVAVIWGLIRAVRIFVGGLFQFFGSSTFDWSEVWLILVAAIIEGVRSAWSIPAWVWNWAKFEHPWWAVIIALVILLGSGGSRR